MASPSHRPGGSGSPFVRSTGSGSYGHLPAQGSRSASSSASPLPTLPSPLRPAMAAHPFITTTGPARHASPLASSPPRYHPIAATGAWGLPRPSSVLTGSQSMPTGFAGMFAPFRPESRGSTSTAAAGGGHKAWAPGEDWAKEWSWTGVDILVSNVRAIRDEVERTGRNAEGADGGQDPGAGGDLGAGQGGIDGGADTDDESYGDVVNYSIGDNRWKIELVRAESQRSAPSTPTVARTTASQYLFPSSGPSQGGSLSSSPLPADPNSLSLFLTCHALEMGTWAAPLSLSVGIFVGVRPISPTGVDTVHESDDNEWAWKIWVEERSFEREREVWEYHPFPSLSSLLLHPQIAEQDAFVLRVQIATPSTLGPPVVRGGGWIPTSLMTGLETLLDDPHTADVCILVAERDIPPADCDPFSLSETDVSSVPPSEATAASRTPRYRKRILYAHAGIMKSRSEYFAAMLGTEGAWAESGHGAGWKKGMHVVRIEDFDFTTVYWLLRWLYTNRISFLPHEDVRSLPPHERSYLAPGWLASFDPLSPSLGPPSMVPRSSRSSPSSSTFAGAMATDPWGWTTFSHTSPQDPATPQLGSYHPHYPPSRQQGGGYRHYRAGSSSDGGMSEHSFLETVSEGGALPSSSSRRIARRPGQGSKEPLRGEPSLSPAVDREGEERGRVSPLQSFAAAYAAAANPHLGRRVATTPTPTGRVALGRGSSAGSASQKSGSSTSGGGSTRPGSNAIGKKPATSGAGPSKVAGAPTGGVGVTAPTQQPPPPPSSGGSHEPHAHPVAVTDKASALAVYRLAHQYHLEPLMELAQTQLIATLTPRTAFPLLLSTHCFPELHGEVRSYCLKNYYLILQEPELARCYAEVGGGLWENGGDVLLSFTMSLVPTPSMPRPPGVGAASY